MCCFSSRRIELASLRVTVRVTCIVDFSIVYNWQRCDAGDWCVELLWINWRR